MGAPLVPVWGRAPLILVDQDHAAEHPVLNWLPGGAGLMGQRPGGGGGGGDLNRDGGGGGGHQGEASIGGGDSNLSGAGLRRSAAAGGAAFRDPLSPIPTGFTLAPPAGLEPAPPAPEAGALSAELRGREL
jgi:hypothetical protein